MKFSQENIPLLNIIMPTKKNNNKTKHDEIVSSSVFYLLICFNMLKNGVGISCKRKKNALLRVVVNGKLRSKLHPLHFNDGYFFRLFGELVPFEWLQAFCFINEHQLKNVTNYIQLKQVQPALFLTYLNY